MTAQTIPPLPEGFTLDTQSSVPPLPEGFTLDTPEEETAPQQGRPTIGDVKAGEAFVGSQGQIIPKGEGLSPEEGRLILELGGALGLGALAPPAGIVRATAILGPRIGPVVARMFMAGAGGAGGSVAAEAVDPSENPLKSAVTSGAIAAGGEGAGAAVFKVGEKALAPFAQQLEPVAKAAIDKISRLGGVVTPGTAVDNKAIDLLENVAEGSFLGGGTIEKAKIKSAQIAEDLIKGFSDDIASTASKEEVGAILQEGLEEGAEAFKAVARGKYQKLDELVGDVNVDITSLKQKAQKILESSEQGLGDPTIRKITRSILSKDDNISFLAAQELRSDLLGIGRGGTDFIKGKGAGAGKLLAKSVDDQMTAAAGGLSDEALGAWREANAIWKQGKDTFNSSLVKSLAKKDPDAVFRTFVKPNNPTSIRKIRTLIDDDEVWNEVKGNFINDLIVKAADPQTTTVSGRKILTDLKRFGDDSLKEIIPSEVERVAFRELVETLALTQKQAGRDQSGKMLIQLTQGGAALNLLAGSPAGGEASSFAVLLGPAALARAFTNKSLAKWLTVGLKAPAGSKEAIKASSQVLLGLQKEGLIGNIEARDKEK